MSEGAVQPEMLEHFVREELNRTTHRVMAVLHPLKIVITNFPHSEVSTHIHMYTCTFSEIQLHFGKAHSMCL